MPNARQLARSSAFTLIEILIVITIIAMLVAILAPSLASAKERANRAKCSSNLRQIGVASFLYANDHNGWLWSWWPDSVNAVGGGGWPTENPGYFDQSGLSNYLKKTEVLYCPSRLRRPLVTGGNPLSCQTIQQWGSLHLSLRHYCPVRGLNVNNDSRFIFVSERVHYNFYSWVGGAGGGCSQPNDWTEVWPMGSLGADSNHGTEGSNLLFVDGRVEWKKGDPGPFYASYMYPPELAPVFYGPAYCFYGY